MTTPPTAAPTPYRAIALLAVAGFASQSMVRVSDSLLPEIADDFATTVGSAAIVVTAYGFAHGAVQSIIGPVGDRFGKYKVVTAMTALTAVLVFVCALAPTLDALAVARLCSGLTAGWIIPLSMAFVGDVTPYERRQPILARYLTGQIFGQLFGQAAGGILGDLMGWRNVFMLLSSLFVVATALLILEMIRNPATREPARPEERSRGLIADYKTVLGNPWARVVIAAIAVEGAVAWGVYAYVGASLYARYGLSLTLVGAFVAAFAVGGLLYIALVNRLVRRFGQIGLAINGGVLLGISYLILTVGPAWWSLPLVTMAIGFGFYMLHNTLQTNATQMVPEARGTAVAIFSSALYLGTAVGVALAAIVVDATGAVPLFAGAAALLPALGLWFSYELRKRRRALTAVPGGA